MSLGTLTIDIAANVARLQSDLGSAHHQLEKFAQDAEKFVGGLAIGVGVNQFREWINGAIDAADAAGKAAQKIGITTESFSKLDYAASLSDLSAEEFTAGMVKLDKAIAAAGDGAKKEVAAFRDLGVEVKDSSGKLKNADEVLFSMSDTFAKSKDGINKTAAALDVLGKSGAGWIPMLNAGSEGLREAGEEAERFGKVVSSDAAAAAEEFNDSITALQARSAGLALDLAKDLLPTLNNITAAMREAGEIGDLGIGDALAFSLKVIATIGAEVSLTFRDIGDAIGALSAAAVSAAKGEFAAASMILDESERHRDEMIAKTDEFVARVWSKPAEEARASVDRQKSEMERLASAALEAQQKAEKVEEQRRKKIEDLVLALEKQAKTIDQTTAQTKLYELVQLRATAADLQRAQAAQKTIDAYERQQEVYQRQTELLERVAQLGQEALTPEARAVLDLKEKYDDLNTAVAEHQMSQEEAGKVKGGLTDNFLSTIDDDLMTDEERLKDSYDRRAKMLEDAHDRGLVAEERYQRTSVKLAEKYAKDAEQLELQKKAMMLGNAASIADGLAGIAAASAGKQSGIYKILFAASKAFAIAEAIVKIQAGIASAAALPFPSNIPAMATVVATTASIIPTIRGADMGSAHAGLDYVPEDATYVLKQGERVLAPKQNQDLNAFMSRQQPTQPSEVHVHLHGVQDYDTFRRSRRQLESEVRRVAAGG